MTYAYLGVKGQVKDGAQKLDGLLADFFCGQASSSYIYPTEMPCMSRALDLSGSSPASLAAHTRDLLERYLTPHFAQVSVSAEARRREDSNYHDVVVIIEYAQSAGAQSAQYVALRDDSAMYRIMRLNNEGTFE